MAAKTFNIIAIDDEVTVLRLLERVCKTLGDFHGFSDPNIALEQLTTVSAVDALILDLEMPEVHGLNVLRQIRSNPDYKDLPVIVMTGSASDETESAALAAGATDFVAKPVSPEILRLRIKVHCENLRLRKSLSRQALTDPLTDLTNRRGLSERLKAEICRAARFQSALAVALFDIDHFKHVNDTYGHPTGDLALQSVAQHLRTSFQRASDIVARVGGEEFMLVSAGTSLHEFCARIESFRSAVASERIRAKTLDVEFGLTLSAGAFRYTPEQRCDESQLSEYLMEMSDLALYEAKVTRDRLVWTDFDASGQCHFHTFAGQNILKVQPEHSLLKYTREQVR